MNTVFSADDYLYFYNTFLTAERTDREVAFLVQALDLRRPMNILDLACGHGRHANRLAALGHQVTGIDSSVDFLAIAQADAARRGVQVRYVQKDMRRLNEKNAFDRALLLFTSFGYFSDADNLRVLKKIGQAMVPGGLFCLDIHDRDTFLKQVLPQQVVEKGSDRMIDEASYDLVTKRVLTKRTILRDGVIKDKSFSVRFYSRGEITALLAQAGLSVREVSGDWKLEPFGDHSRRMLIVAEKLS